MVDEHQPNVVLMDIGMPELNGIDATAQIVRHSPNTGVLILSMFSDERYVIRTVHAGAKGYLLKDTVEQDLLQAIRAVDRGHSYFSPAISKILLENYSRELKQQFVEDRYECLTERERQVYQLLAEGKTNKMIAALLKLSLHTVETHRFRIMDKLDVHTSAELVLSAVRRGLVS
jgi:DNA-binding NarL/FixJ family response regulator